MTCTAICGCSNWRAGGHSRTLPPLSTTCTERNMPVLPSF